MGGRSARSFLDAPLAAAGCVILAEPSCIQAEGETRARTPARLYCRTMKAFNETGQRRAVGAVLPAVLLGWSLLATGQEPPASQGTLRVEVNVVNILCTVKDKRGALVTDLGKSDFDVFEDGKKQELKYFARETDRPLTLALLVDTSGSMEDVLSVEKDSATQFLRQVLRPSDLTLLITFDLSVDLLQDFTADTERLEQEIGRASCRERV